MKKLTKFLAVFLLMLLISPNAWAWSIDNAEIYYDNSYTQWEHVQFVVEKSDGSAGFGMQKIANTNLFYKKMESWNNNSMDCFRIGATTSDNDWGWDSKKSWERFNQTNCTGTWGDNVGGWSHLFYYNSSTAGSSLTRVSNASSYEGLNLNKTQTIQVMVKAAGGTYTEKAYGLWPATIKAKRYKLNDARTANVTDADLSSATFTSVITSTAKIYKPTANTGYTFKGWGTSSSATPSDASSDYSYTVSGATTIYAFFAENTYSITFEANGGSGSMTSQTGLGCATAQTIKTNSFTAPTGHHFTGWNTEADGSGTAYEAGGIVPALTVTEQGGTLTLYAQWAPNTHTLTWNWDGGSTSDQNYTKAGTVAYGTAIVYPTDASMSYAGHNFTGWDKSNTTMPDADLTITAQWVVASSYTLSFAKGCEDEVTDMPESITQSTQTFTIPSNLPRRTGYTFSVWRDNNSEQHPAGGSITITGNTTLTAEWLANTNTPYIVNHKRQALDGTYPANLTETENKTGTTATAADLTTKNYTGFTTPATQEATILADGSLVVDYEYERQSFILTWDLNGGTAGTGTITPAGSTKYETVLQYTVDPTRTGYTFTGWNPEMTSGTTTMPAANTTYTAQWQAKSYTISFDNAGGMGGQTETVTATYAAAMPALQNFTAPTRVGYKFNGYWSQQTGGTQYYTNTGVSAHTWDIDQATPTLYAQWTQMHVYVQGRMHVANKKRSEGGDITWTNSFTSGTSDETTNQWATACRAIEMQLVTENDRTYYKLVTNATLSDLSTKFSGGDNLWQYFYLRSTSTTSGSTWDGSIYKQVENGNSFKLADRGEEHARAWSATGTNQPCFSDDDRSGYVVIYFDETKVWYELDEFPTYAITVKTYGGGTVTPSGTHQIGEVSLEISAQEDDDHIFNGWTVRGSGITIDNANQATTKITATGAGEVSANFKKASKVYFQTCDGWGNDVYVYFYKGTYWDNAKGTGSYGIYNTTGNCISAGHMKYTGKDNIHYYKYDPDDLRSKGMSNVISFTQVDKYGHEFFAGPNSGDKVHVAYTDGFHPCDQPLYVAEGWEKDLNDDGKGNKLAAYYKGHWSNMLGDDAEDYLMMLSENWKAKEEMRFKKDNNGNWIVIKNYSGFASDYHDEFRIWRNCDGNWYGCGQTDSHNQNITSDISGWKLYTGTSNIDITPWKEGDYEFKWNPNSQELSVTYLGDITVANFPGEVSTFVNRQHKVKPDVTLRNGTNVENVTITVNDNNLPYETTIATYEQNGTNLIITGKDIGTENLTVVYKNNKVPPYTVERTLKVNVAEPIVIQAMLEKDEDNDESTKDDYWSNTGLMHIHFWGSDAETAQDLPMSYNKETKVFSVTAPKIVGFKFMFWYGEDINMSANEKWRKTNDIEDCEESTCYSISYGISKTETRTATAKEDLCSTDEYYVEITMKNGNTYKSNTISGLEQKVSFYAPKDGVSDYTGGSVRIVHNGEVSNPLTGFSQAGVYVAKLASATAFAENSIELYTGNYYIRTDGAHGTWSDYKTDDDNIMISFTPRAEKGETFSYYWVKNVAKTGTGTDGKVNVKADVANDYNDNLAGMIENDKFTDGGGYVYESTNGANVRFSYEPTTNEFKRAILGGAGNNNFLNVYSKTNNLYADNEYSKQLSESADLNDSKFSDLSDWVYEKRVYVRANGANASKVILKSVFNGQTTHLLGYAKNEKGEDTDVPNELEVMGSQSTGDFALRITYDFKKNRLIASWEPGQREISENMIIDSDVLFVQQEAADGTIDNTDVAQITYSQTGIDANAKLTSLKNMIYVLEVTDKVIDNTDADNQLYWICLPFDCRISDIYGVEGYVKLDAGGRAISGTWGIQRYDGANRATHGWFIEDNPQGFWKWMTRDEILKAGTGYVVVFDKTGAGSWPSIDVEEACEGETGGCKDGKKTVQKRSKRLYFPSIGSKFEISYSGSSANVVHYEDQPCNITTPFDRTKKDGNWKVIGPVSYNNIGVDQGAANNLTFYYTYSQDNALAGSAHYTGYAVTADTELKSFHGYMTQFGGNLTWKPFTKSDDVTGKAPLYAVAESEFKGGMLTVELNNAQGEQLDRTFVNLHKNGTLGFDRNMELTKITENCAQIASVCDNVLYAGSTLPLDIELVPLNVKVTANGTYDIALKQSLEGLEVKLFDAFEQTTTLLDLMPATVTLEKGEYQDRFFLQFTQKAPQTPTNLDGSLEQYNLPMDKTQKLLINGNIYLINAGRVYNATGAELR